MSWSEVSAINNELTVPLNTLMYINFCSDKLLNLDSESDVIWAFRSLEQNKMLGLCFYYLSGSKYPALKKFGTFAEIMKDNEAVNLVASNELLVSAIVMTGENSYGDIFSKNQTAQYAVLNNSKAFEALASEKYSASNLVYSASMKYLQSLFASKEAVNGFCKSPWSIFFAIYWHNKDKYKFFNDCAFIDAKNAQEINKTAYFNKDILKMCNSKKIDDQDKLAGSEFKIGTKTEYKCSYKDSYTPGLSQEKYDESFTNMYSLHYICAHKTADKTGDAGDAYTLASNTLLWKSKPDGSYTNNYKCILGGIKCKNTTVKGNVYNNTDHSSFEYKDR